MAITLRSTKGATLTHAEMDANFTSFMTLSGSGASRELLGITAPFKSFLIDHPTKDGMKLQYGSLESPYHGVRLTGEATITGNSVIVELPDYIYKLCKQDGATVQVTNIKHSMQLWIEELEVENNRFVVAMNRADGDSNQYRFYWSFTAVRKDVDDLLVELKAE